MKTLHVCGLLAAVSIAALASPLAAQTIKPTPEGEAAATAARSTDQAAIEDAAAAQVTRTEDIIVTGSRIQNPNFTAPTPVQVLTSETIQQRAPAQIADVVNEIPAFRVSRSSQGSGRIADQQSGVQSLIDLRGLGDTRTLVLVNGHRHVGTVSSGSFDTNLIPVGLVERVEVVTGGASAAYGSDAVAGVTNFILRNRLKGLSASVQAGVTERGDGAQYVGTLAGGFSAADDRLHVIAGVDGSWTEGTGNIYGRGFGQAEPGLLAVSAAQRTALGLPAQVFSNGVELANVAVGSLIQTAATGLPTTQRYAFDANGNPFVFNQGTVFGTGTTAVMTGSTSNAGYNSNSFFPLQNKNSRIVAYGRAEYELAEHLAVFVEGNYGHSDLPPQLTSSYLTQFQVPRTSLPAALQSLYTGTNVTLGRIMTENGGGNLTYQNIDVHRYVGGLEGNFGKFSANIYYQHGQTHQDFNTSGLVLSALYEAVYGCNGTATNPNLSAALLTQLAAYKSISGKSCVAFNPIGVNTNTAALAYIYNNQHQDTYITQDVASGSISGSPFALWAGDVSIAVGGEYRRDKLRVVAEPLGLANVFSQGNFTTYGGRNTVKEVFGELGVPLLHDMVIHALDLNGAIRRTDYKLSGAVTTWKLGATLEPIEGLRLRATKSRDIRAPNLNELFFVGGALPTSLTNNIPGTFGYQVTSTSNVNGAGNQTLVPEKADTFTAGGTVQIRGGMFSGFRAAVDYYKIEINGAISRPNSAQSQSICATVIAGGATTCPGFVFNTVAGTNGITSQANLSINLNKLKAEGIDFELGYRSNAMPFGLPGRFELRALANHAIHLQQYLTLIRPQPFETAGSAQGVPKWTGNITFGYNIGRSGFDLQLRGFTKVKYDVLTAFTLAGGATNGAYVVDPTDGTLFVNTNANTISQNRFGGRTYLNFSGHVGVGAIYQLFAVVNNLLDSKPPLYAPIAVTTGNRNLNYDLLGRSYKVGARVNF